MPRIIITEPDTTPQPYRLPLDKIVTKIGRAQDNDVILSDGSSSAYHCKMKRVEGGFILADLNSTNGIKFEECRYSIIDLKNEQTVQIGDHIDLEFTLTEEEIAELAKEDFESHQTTSVSEKNTKSSDNKSDILDDDEIKLQEVTPKESPSSKTNKPKQTKPSSDRKPKQHQVKQSNTGLSFIIFMVLAVLCFLAGLAIKHYQEYGTFIFS